MFKKIKKNDTVKVLVGKDNGKTAKVLRVMPKQGKILVEGINVYKRHVSGKRLGQDTEGRIIDIPKPLDISNVMLVCPSCKKPARTGVKLVNRSKFRICKRCGKEILDEQTKRKVS